MVYLNVPKEILDKLHKGLIYARVSTKDQVSTSAQVGEIKTALTELGLEICVIVEDKKKATKDEQIIDLFEYISRRPKLKDAIELAKKKKLDFIIVWKYDRLARDQPMQELMIRYLKTLGIEVIALKDEFNPLIRTIKGKMSEDEIEKIRERVDVRMQELIKNGELTTRVPYGFELKKIFDSSGKVKSKRIVNDAKKQRIVKTIFKDMIKYIKKKDKTPLSKIQAVTKLSKPMILKILKNPFYVGYFSFKGVVYKPRYKINRLISLEDFKKINPYFKEPKEAKE